MTTPFSIQAHQVTTGHSALVAAFKSLEDGDYTATILPAGSAVAMIDGIVEWYRAASENQGSDPNYLNTLLHKADELAYWLSKAAVEVGQCYSDKLQTEVQRKNAYNQAMHEAKRIAAASSQKFVASTAEIDANHEIRDLAAAEALADAIHRQITLITSAAESILMRMSQKLAVLRDEMGYQMRGGGR